MQSQFFIDVDGRRDGPHDLVTIMRRIRVGKILGDTAIYIDESTQAVPARSIPDIAVFFDRVEPPVPAGAAKKKAVNQIPSVKSLISTGWNFTMENSVMTVYSGSLLLLSILLAIVLIGALGIALGGIAAWCVFLTLHNFYLVFTLRLYRGQMPGSDFINRYIAPILITLILTCVVMAMMIAGGAFLLLAPAIVVASFYIFAPFLILDHRYTLIEAMEGSRLLLQKHDRAYISLVMWLVLIHFISLVLIIPIPLTLPMFAAALSDIYEKLSAP